jgi:FdrA protein
MKYLRVLKSEYRDSLFLMQVSLRISEWPGVIQAIVVMGTESNQRILKQAGFHPLDFDNAKYDDIIIAIEFDTDAPKNDYIAELDQLLAQSEPETSKDRIYPDLSQAIQENPEANLVVISTPGEYAAEQARQALVAGKNVFCFSHHIPIETEISLKDLAIEKQLLMMGPDCGTTILDGVGLGFANQIRQGPIGIISASGSGLQEVVSLIHRSESGISQAIGVGGRDLSDPVDGRMAELALRWIAALPQTKVIILLAKKASERAVERLFQAAALITQPLIICFQDYTINLRETGEKNSVLIAKNYKDCARLAVLCAGDRWLIPDTTKSAEDWIDRNLPTLPLNSLYFRGLFAGGSLCAEAYQILSSSGCVIQTNLAAPVELSPNSHGMLDLGSEEYTQGRAHPFIDHRLRAQEIDKAFADPSVAILLVDVVLGWGCHADPAGELISALRTARTRYSKNLAVIASVCGTPDDPQDYNRQRQKLEAEGVFVAESNADAARLACDMLIAIQVKNHPPRNESVLDDTSLLKAPPVVINLGLSIFENGPQAAGIKVFPVRWTPKIIVPEEIKTLLDGLL